MSQRKLMDGNAAMTAAMCLARVQVISAYPITPQSPVAERLSEEVERGALRAEYIRVESEHSALSAAIGAQLTGARACTATSSVGLALMHEVLGMAAGVRVPVVMGIVNRSLAAPWSLWCDHQDTMAERDAGWIQLYCQSVQDVIDNMLIAYRLAEHPDVLTPAMVCIDGFFLSHTAEVAMVPDQAEVDAFLPPYRPQNTYLSVEDPMFINNLTPTAEFGEMRYQQREGLDNALRAIGPIQAEFEERFGRRQYVVERYRCEDAEVALVALGSMAGTAHDVVDQLRQAGKKVGLVRPVLFRPFPTRELREALDHIPTVGVLDRCSSAGAQAPPLCTEIRAACGDGSRDIVSFVGGLGGRDISPATLHRVFDHLYRVREGADALGPIWVDVGEDYAALRPGKAGGDECTK